MLSGAWIRAQEGLGRGGQEAAQGAEASGQLQ